MTDRRHAISYDWVGATPRLLCRITGSGEIVEHDLWHPDMVISHHAVCVGSWQGGGHVPCPDSARVSGGNVCPECAGSLLPVPECMFEPLCDGERCASRFCQQEHAVYLAFHGSIAKVGMTSSRRIERRMREQGCDAFSVLARVDGRASARKLEGALAEKLALRQRIRDIEALANMAVPLPADIMEERYSMVAESVEGMGLKPSPLKFIDDYPLETPLAAMPSPASIPGRHSGRVLGLKGKFMVYEHDGLRALNMARVPGRFIRPADGRELCSRPLP